MICRETFLAEHPQHIAALRDYFADVDLIERLANGSPDAPSDRTAATPRQFGEYELLGEIGRGGMGIVFRARERSTGRCIALKMLLRGRFLSSAEVLRFRNESSTAAALRHRGIIPIYHVGELQGRLFYTMPLIEGSNLAERIAAGPLDPEIAAIYYWRSPKRSTPRIPTVSFTAISSRPMSCSTNIKFPTWPILAWPGVWARSSLASR